jgi:decaprenylphospho-beta-D-erythro-pentofuranosid-2-ulose 2-reductase
VSELLIAPGLVADPERAGAAIVRALDGLRDVVYVPGFWRYIMWIIRAVPEPIFKRIRL